MMDSDNFSNPQNSSDSGSEDRPANPGRRLRRLIASSDQDNSSGSTGYTSAYSSDDRLPGSAAGDWSMGVNPLTHPERDLSQPPGGASQPSQPTPPPGTSYGQSGPQSSAPTPPQPGITPASRRPSRGYTTGSTPPPPGQTGAAPLPQRVNEFDTAGTQVSPAAFQPARTSPQPPTYPIPVQRQAPVYPYPQQPGGYYPPQPPAAVPPDQAEESAGEAWRSAFGCLLRAAIGLLFLGVFAVLVGLSFFVFQYFSIAASLPNIDNLSDKASQFETTRLLDRNGGLMYEIIDPNAGRRTYVPIDKISPYVVAATIATEDKEYWNNPGFDPLGILRALIQNYTSGEIVSGASTITQQLARNLLLSPEERAQRTVQRKAREIVLASELTRRYSKEKILELYLNEAYYGNMAYGIEAAAETYFNTTADKLNFAQAAFLAGLPQAPSVYDIYTNRDVTLNRFKQVLLLMYQDSQEKNCIYVGGSGQPVCVDAAAASSAVDQISVYQFTLRQFTMSYPHWVNFIRTQLELQFDPQIIYQSGFTVYTTLDPALQTEAEKIVKDQIAKLEDKHATDGALVAIRPSTGEILSMVGSADFYNEAISGQVNMAVAPRQPGSAIKPLTYVAAFEKGWTPATLIWDVPSDFPPSGNPSDLRPPYRPVNYDGRYHGPQTVRYALANSFNVPAVKALQYVGIYDDPSTSSPDGLIAFARRLGIDTLTRPDYGLALTLGGGDVPLLQLTGAYSVFATGGRRIPPVAITKIVDHNGNVVFEYKAPAGDQVVRPEHAYLISSILSDNEARTPMFGADSVLNLPFPVAVKTGTTNDYRDNWTVGYTPDLVTGVWVGNADYTPMINTSGVTGAAPIWAQFMEAAMPKLGNGAPSPFIPPSNIMEKTICAVSGAEPSEWCTNHRVEVFASDQPPLTSDQDLWQKTTINTWNGLSESDDCPDFNEEKFVMNVKDESARKWIKEDAAGQKWAKENGFEDPIYFAPERACKNGDPRAYIQLVGLKNGQTINGTSLDIYAVAYATKAFKNFRLEWGKGSDPKEWKQLGDVIKDQYKQPEQIYTWNFKKVPNGVITLRLYMESTQGGFAEQRIHLNIQAPSPTPTSSPMPTSTATPLPPTPEPPTPMPPTPVPPTPAPPELPTPTPNTPVPPTPQPPTP
jgi:penicillin-binding protein 1C